MQWVKHAVLGLLHHLAIWRLAWREENKRKPKTLPKGKELEFLPAVLEIQETPASPVGRAIGFTVITLFLRAIVWACFGEIDIVAVAQGKIVPSDHSKVIQPVETGMIRVIHIRDGQKVKPEFVNQGDLLLELDATASDADQQRLQNEATATKIEIARLQAILADKQTLTVSADIDPQIVNFQQQMLTDKITEQQARVSVATLQVEQHKASIELAEINISRLEQTIPLLEERVEAVKGMLKDNFASRTEYLKLQEEQINKVQELGALKQDRLRELAALAESKKILKSPMQSLKPRRASN
jgi:hemolysin D